MSFESSPELPGSFDEIPLISDPKALRALAHPVRVALIELLTVQGPQTATQAAERVGVSPSACSFHLRQLARYGFVEEAGGGAGRARPWRVARIGIRFESTDVEGGGPASTVAHLMRERAFDRYRGWRRTPIGADAAWSDAVIDDEYVMWATPEEMAVLTAELRAILLTRFRGRLSDPSSRPAGAVPVEVLALAYPVPDGLGRTDGGADAS